MRSDLDHGRSGTVQPVIVKQALERSPGISHVAGFGPVVGGELSAGRYVDRGLGIATQALEVFHVDRDVDPVVAYDAADIATVVGGPESLLELAAAGQLPDAPTVLAGDLPGQAALGRVLLTDGMRRRAVAFGQGRDNTSATLGAAEADEGPRPARDYLPTWGKALATTVTYDGVSAIRAASSWAQVGISGGSRPEHHPYAAFDGDPATSWHPAPGQPSEGQWITVEFDEPQTVAEVRVVFDGDAGALPTRITVDAGVERVPALTFGDSVTVKLAGVHAIRSIRVTVEQVLVSDTTSTFGIAEVVIPDVQARRTLTLPTGPLTSEPAAVVLAAAPGVPSCFFHQGRPRCSPGVARGSEDGDRIDRTVVLPEPGFYVPTVWTRARPGYWLNAVLDREAAASNPLGLAPTVTASSIAVDDPVARPGAVLDGDPRTAWMPAANDGTPMLRLSWLAPRTITGLRMTLPDGVAATRPGALRVVGNDGIAGGFLNGDGDLIFDRPLLTDTLTIFLLDAPRARLLQPLHHADRTAPGRRRRGHRLPGRAETAHQHERGGPVGVREWPDPSPGSATIQSRVVATRRELLELRETVAQPCVDGAAFPMSVPRGSVRIVAAATGLAVASRLSLEPSRVARDSTATTVRIVDWTAPERRINVDAYPAERLLAVRENTNPGWRARADGRLLVPVVVDGWQQGWILPAGFAGDVALTFVPDAAYRSGLAVGALLLLGVVVAALLPVGRRGSHAPRPVPVRRGRSRILPFLVGSISMILLGGYLGAGLVLVAVVAAAYRFQVPRRSQGRPSGALELWLPAVLLLIGGWVYLTVDNAHRTAWPQVLGLAAVAGLWLSVVARTATRPSLAPTQQRPLQQVIAGRGNGDGPDDGEGERGDEVAGERSTIADAVTTFEHQRVPKEDSVRDSS